VSMLFAASARTRRANSCPDLSHSSAFLIGARLDAAAKERS
jgi:hypothetical protein